jgi:CheY-like chemotaxis protein
MWRILLVDDNPADIRLVMEALKASRFPYQVTAVENGKKALTLLRWEGMGPGVPLPDLILLDLNLPQMDGHTVLAVLKADPMLHRIPVVVFTTSHSKEDERQAYQLGATHFLIKPDTWAEYQKVVDVIGSLCSVKLP